MALTRGATQRIAALVLLAALLGACNNESTPTTPVANDSTSTTTATTARDFDTLVGELESQADAAASSGGVLVYVRQGKDSTVIARGLADEKTDRAMVDTDTVMVGSVTKAWVAAATLSLVAEDKIALDDTVEQWLPGLVPGAPVTVEQLLSMTAGLASYDTAPDYPGPGKLPARDLVELAKTMPNFRAFEPGARTEEANTNYAVLGLILEKAGGESVPDLVHDRVFTRAALEDSAFGGTPTAHGYEKGVDQTTVAPQYPSTASSGVATVTDVAEFLDALLAERIVPAALVSEMTSVRGSDGTDDFGLGLRQPRGLPCPGVWGQKGGNAAFAVRAYANPALDRTIVVAVTPGNNESVPDAMAKDAICG